MMTLILGGSGSGKSEFAESYVVARGEMPRYYIATMIPYDEECERRIIRHRAMRKEKGFATVEQPTHIADCILRKKGIVLLECMSNLLANEMYQKQGRHTDTDQVIVKELKELEKQAEELVIVSNDIFLEEGTYDEFTMQYIEKLANINKEVARQADRVIEIVYGIPVIHKGGTYETGNE